MVPHGTKMYDGSTRHQGSTVTVEHTLVTQHASQMAYVEEHLIIPYTIVIAIEHYVHVHHV